MRRSTTAPARCAAAAASPSASRLRFRRPRRSRSSMSPPTAATTLYTSTVDMGQGSDTAFAQIVAEVLDVQAEDVRVVASGYRRDALRHGHARLALAVSHGQCGAACRRGCPRQNCARLPPKPGCPKAPIIRRRKYSRSATACRPAMSSARRALCRPTNRPTRRPACRITSRRSGWSAAPASRSKSIPKPGMCASCRLVNAADCGKPINPGVARTQLSGAAIMQLGFTLSEDMQLDGGQVTNASLADYKIPGIGDIPPMENELVDAEQHSGPFGAKGLGESGTFGVSPAIANAIHDAVGVRITELPITAEVGAARSARQSRPPTRGRMMSTRTINFTLNGQAVSTDHRAAPQSRRAVAAVRPVRRARKLRPGPVRLLHRAGRRQGGFRLPLFRALGRRQERHHRRTSRCRRRAVDRAAGFHRLRRVPVRLLHAGLRADGASVAEGRIPIRATTTSAIISPAISAAAPPIRKSSRP